MDDTRLQTTLLSLLLVLVSADALVGSLGAGPGTDVLDGLLVLFALATFAIGAVVLYEAATGED